MIYGNTDSAVVVTHDEEEDCYNVFLQQTDHDEGLTGAEANAIIEGMIGELREAQRALLSFVKEKARLRRHPLTSN